jgi:hypothetical protein
MRRGQTLVFEWDLLYSVQQPSRNMIEIGRYKLFSLLTTVFIEKLLNKKACYPERSEIPLTDKLLKHLLKKNNRTIVYIVHFLNLVELN